jgi:hypothetical protein
MSQATGVNRRAELGVLCAALALFAGLLAGLAACGSDDLVFPGEVPFTATPEETATATTDDDDV